MGRITPIGVVLIVVMVAGFTYGFLGHGTGAGFSLLVAAGILLLVAGSSFTRGGRAGRGIALLALVEQSEEARRAREDRTSGERES